MIVTVAGIDPGLVHTGVVILYMDTEVRVANVQWAVINGPNVAEANRVLDNFALNQVFIEGYRTRGQFSTNDRMIRAVAEFKAGIKQSIVLPNMGVKKVVKPRLLTALHLEQFPATNHQDLQSAARILVLGMLKDPRMNRVLADFIKDTFVMGNTWRIEGN